MNNRKKKYEKIRYYLGDSYHLHECYTADNKWEFKLYRKYEGWMKDNSGPIMTSEDHTYEDLYKFAKKHRKYNIRLILPWAYMALAWIALILSFIGGYTHNDSLRYISRGIDISIFVICPVHIILSWHNSKVELMEIEERFKELFKE